MRRYLKRFAVALLVAALLAGFVYLPIGDWLIVTVRWIQSHRELAWLAYIGTYVIATVLAIPGSILTLVGGFVFGLPLGVALVSAGSVLGAVSAFLVGRFFARDWVARRIAELPRFRALDLATRHEGFVIVFLARLSPLFPFNLLNYGLSLTGVRLKDYALASWLGMLPATVLYVYIGTLAKSLAELRSGDIESGAAGQILLVVGFAATVLLTIFVTRKATATLREHLEREMSGAESSDDAHERA